MHKVLLTTFAAAVFCMSSAPAMSDGTDLSLQSNSFQTLTGITATPLTLLESDRTRGAFRIITPLGKEISATGTEYLPGGLLRAAAASPVVAISPHGCDFDCVLMSLTLH